MPTSEQAVEKVGQALTSSVGEHLSSIHMSNGDQNWLVEHKAALLQAFFHQCWQPRSSSQVRQCTRRMRHLAAAVAVCLRRTLYTPCCMPSRLDCFLPWTVA